MKFDPSAAAQRVAKFWTLSSHFGVEHDAYHVYLDEIVSDRYQLINGMQLLRDELQFAGGASQLIDGHSGDMDACAVDLTVPSVCTTLGVTNCGDRIHQGETSDQYVRVVASRFATLSEIGELKLEAFSPTGGGTDDGATLAHVTVAHQLDEPLRHQLYAGHAQSFVMVAIDLKTHVGRMNHADGNVEFGRVRESRWRQPRAACGAVVGMLKHFNPKNPVHVRLRRDLGEENYEFLRNNPELTNDGHDVTAAVAAAIIAIQGMLNTAHALATELDERGVAHLTASTTVNRVSQDDTLLYLARATVFNGTIRVQGLGTDARKYKAMLVVYPGNDQRMAFFYDGHASSDLPITEIVYPIRYWDPQSAKPIEDEEL